MSKYIDADKLIAELRRQKHELELSIQSQGDYGQSCQIVAYENVLALITSLQQEQPDNEDIDKVAQELYEHLYELKRRNNVPTNLYDKQEIIDLWKAGIEYGRNHPKQEQPEVDLVAELKHHLATTPKEQLEKEWKELEPWGNIGPTVREFLYGKQPEVDLEEEIFKTERNMEI